MQTALKDFKGLNFESFCLGASLLILLICVGSWRASSEVGPDVAVAADPVVVAEVLEGIHDHHGHSHDHDHLDVQESSAVRTTFGMREAKRTLEFNPALAMTDTGANGVVLNEAEALTGSYVFGSRTQQVSVLQRYLNLEVTGLYDATTYVLHRAHLALYGVEYLLEVEGLEIGTVLDTPYTWLNATVAPVPDVPTHGLYSVVRQRTKSWLSKASQLLPMT